MRLFFSSLLFLALSMAAVAQAPISGSLVGANDGKPLPFANVALLRASDSSFVSGSTSSEQGRFVISNYADKLASSSLPLLLRISSIGYQTLFVPLNADSTRLGTLSLRPVSTTLNEVRITADRPLYAVDGEKNLYSVKDDPAIHSGSAADALQNAPGVEVDAEGNITLRGTQSVSVWINDRPSHLSPEGLKQYIKTLPANAIDRIEVIENPSARYGGGTAVVNIVTSAKVTLNQFVSFGAVASSLPIVNPWASYVYADEKFSINAFLGYQYSAFSNNSSDSSLRYDDQHRLSESFNSSSTSSYRTNQCWLYINGNYDVDSSNSLAFWGGVYPSWTNLATSSSSLRQAYIFSPGRYHYADSVDERFVGWGGFLGLDYTHLFDNDGHKLNVSLSGNGNGNNDNITQHRLFDQATLLNFFDSRHAQSSSYTVSLSADYVRPFASNWIWELGFDNSFGQQSDLLARDTLALSNVYFRDTLRSHSFSFTDASVDLYSTLQWRYEAFSVKVGLRGSYKYDLISNLYDKSSSYHRDFFNLIPSLHLSYRTASMHNFSLSYTLRSAYPSISDLNSTPVFSLDSYSQGNADLLPSRTHHFTANWTKYFSGFGSVGAELLYQATLDEHGSLADVRYSDAFGRIVPFTQPVNIGRSSYGGLDINVTYQPAPFLNVRLQLGAFDNYFKFQYRPGEWFDKDKWYLRARLNVWAKLWQVLDVFANVSYNTPTLGLLRENAYSFNADLGLSADLCHRMLSIFLVGHNIFNTQRDDILSLNPYASGLQTNRYNTRLFALGLTFRFGKMELENRARTGNNMSF